LICYFYHITFQEFRAAFGFLDGGNSDRPSIQGTVGEDFEVLDAIARAAFGTATGSK